LYRQAPLRRPVADADLWQMYERSSLVVSAWTNGRLAGIARIMTDGFAFSYICDFAVAPDVQKAGVGRKLLDEVRKECVNTTIFLYDPNRAAKFYSKMGFEKQEGMWVMK
jgi:ribosomal protein S18 acetylase RimI-like enzyme